MVKGVRKLVTTVSLDEESKRQLRFMAKNDLVSESAIARQAIRAFFLARNLSLTQVGQEADSALSSVA